MNAKRIEDAKDRDLAASLTAIKRAARSARERAAQTGTDLIVEQDSAIVRLRVVGATRDPSPVTEVGDS